jgi:hypothetical protein
MPPGEPAEILIVLRDILNWALLIPTVLGTVCWTAYGIRLSRLSGFKFYLTSGLVQALAYCLALSLFFFVPALFAEAVVGASLLYTPVIHIWQVVQTNRVGKAHPSKWRDWMSTAKQVKATSFWDRVFLRLGAVLMME